MHFEPIFKEGVVIVDNIRTVKALEHALEIYKNFEVDKHPINKYREGKLDYYDCPGIDGDGFHYDILTVPDEATYQSLGIQLPFTFDLGGLKHE